MSRSLEVALCLVTATAIAACDSSGGDSVPLVDETGFLKGDLIRYTAPSPLGETPVSVAIIGLPGAVTSPGGELMVAGGGSATPVSAAVASDGSFVAGVSATLDQTITLRYLLSGREDTLDLMLADALGGVPAPVVASSTGSGGGLRVVVGSDGTISLDLDQLIGRTTDVIVFNEDNGAALRATPAERTASLLGQRGDRICVFALAAESASTSVCTVAN